MHSADRSVVRGVGSVPEESDPTRICAVLSDDAMYGEIVEYVDRRDEYELLPADRTDPATVDFDICVLDEQALREHGTRIRERKATAPVFLPVVLVSSSETVEGVETAVRAQVDHEIWRLVDEIVTAPIDPVELARRLDTVARIRAQSVALERTAEQLLLLNRITRHDIRNEMQIVMAWADELEAHTDDRGERMRERIVDSGQHVVDLTKAVREFVETLRTAGDPELEAIDLAEALTDELAKRRSTFEEAEFVVDGSIPERQVLANDLLASVFRNLLNNAVQHNDAETPRVLISVEDREKRVVVTVADNGRGIPPKQREAVLGRTEEGLGHPAAGLGLYLVDTLVEQYGGTVRLTDGDAGGIAVEVELRKASGPEDETDGN